MKKLWICFTFLIFISAEEGIILDPHFSPFTGAFDLRFLQFILMKMEDSIIKSSPQTSLSMVIARALEQTIWATLDSTLTITQHEIFGHGYRLRELGLKPKGYFIHPLEGGATIFDMPPDFTLGAYQTINVAGLEAEAILATLVKKDFLEKNRLDGRASMLYLQPAISLFLYTSLTQAELKEGITDMPGNDILSYVDLLNTIYPDSSMSVQKLYSWATFNWLDPMTFYSIYAWFYYIITGKASKIPTISLSSSTHYLPNIRIGYAPYGPEAYLENFLIRNDKPLYFYIKRGPRSFGLGLDSDHFYTFSRGRLGLRLDVWNQARYLDPTTLEQASQENFVPEPKMQGYTWGGQASLLMHFNLSPSLSLYLEGGGKTDGYLPGYSLKNSFVTKIGFMLR